MASTCAAMFAVHAHMEVHLLLTATDGANKYVIDDDGCERKMSSIKGASHSIH